MVQNWGSEMTPIKSPCAAVPQRLKAVQVTQPKTLYAACVFKALKYFKLLKNQHVIKDFTLPADFWVTRTSLWNSLSCGWFPATSQILGAQVHVSVVYAGYWGFSFGCWNREARGRPTVCLNLEALQIINAGGGGMCLAPLLQKRSRRAAGTLYV